MSTQVSGRSSMTALAGPDAPQLRHHRSAGYALREDISQERAEMSHRHLCDVAGHWWECEGMAAPKYRVSPDWRILGNGRAKRDAVAWMFPPLWPVDAATLRKRGPYLSLMGKGDRRSRVDQSGSRGNPGAPLTRYLLDLNAFIALGFIQHEFHDQLAAWVRAEQVPPFATCSITELEFVRVLAQAPDYAP